MVNLIIDIGNSRTKVALFNQGELMISFPVDKFTPHGLEILLMDYPGIEKAIVSSVKDKDEELYTALKERIPLFVELTHLTPLPFSNIYESPETLGKDRLAAVAGACKLYPNQNVLVIDAGTAITYDFISEKGIYNGGFITPGLMMRFKALNHFTDKLPLLEPGEPSTIAGNNTVNSIKGGIQYSIEGEVVRMINYFSEKYGIAKLIFTGGDAHYLKKLIPTGHLISDLTLLGLNTILEYNSI